MASVLNTNMASLYAQKNLSGAQSALATSVERLSSGLRINRAKDDAAGLGISEKIRSQVTSLNQGMRNANDAISMVQTAEGSLSEVSSILQRMKELSVQARNESLSVTQRSYIADELSALKNEVNSIAERTTFSDLSLLKNALRTDAVGTSADVGKMANGASVLNNLTVSNLSASKANAGTYTITSGTVANIANQQSAVNAATVAVAATARTVTLAAGDVAEGDKLTLSVAGREYSVIVGADPSTGVTGAASVGEVLTQLQNKLILDYPASTASTVTVAAGTLQFTSLAGLGGAEITLTKQSATQGAQIQTNSSSVSTTGASAGVARTLEIKDFDVIEGRKFTISIGNPGATRDYSVIAGSGDNATDIAAKLQDLLEDTYAGDVTSAAGGITIATAGNLGLSRIALSVHDTQLGASTALASTSSVTAQSNANTARTVAISTSDLAEGNVVSFKLGEKEYAVKVGSADTTTTVAQRLANLVDDDISAANMTVSGNLLTFQSGANLGLASMSLNVRTITDPGKLTITADANTGIGGTSQTIDVGSIASGGTKNFNFDKLGVSFTLNNATGAAVNASTFEAFTTKVTQLEVAAQMGGEALFQVGADVAENISINGFKDIRVTGFNSNSGADKEVFDKLSAALDAIAPKTQAVLTEANFATLQSRVEDAITKISDFRGYLGAQQNRIEYAISNLQAQSENLTAANSRIRDTDYAAETANLTKKQIMQQAATAMLAQANQMPNVITALLK
jgi:flagellin